MTACAAIALTTDLLEDLDLLALAGLDQNGGHRGPGDGGGAHGHGFAIAQHQHVAERHGRAGLATELLDDQKVTGLDPVLLAAGLDHRVHRWRLRNLCLCNTHYARELARGREVRRYTGGRV